MIVEYLPERDLYEKSSAIVFLASKNSCNKHIPSLLANIWPDLEMYQRISPPGFVVAQPYNINYSTYLYAVISDPKEGLNKTISSLSELINNKITSEKVTFVFCTADFLQGFINQNEEEITKRLFSTFDNSPKKIALTVI